MPTIFELPYRAGKIFRNYGNPFSLLASTMLRRSRVIVVDRRTRLRFACRRGAEKMFGEIFHARLYDVPVVPLRPGDCVIDVGANHGFFACLCAAAGADVIAFEPDPATLPLLERNVRVNGLTERVRLVAEAVSDTAGELELICTDELGGGMSTIVPEFAARSHAAETARVQVPVAAFADLFDRFAIDRVRLCKLDCEGSELAILRSITASVLARIDAFVIEFHPEAYATSELVDLLNGWADFHVVKVHSVEMGNHNIQVYRRTLLRAWSETVS